MSEGDDAEKNLWTCEDCGVFGGAWGVPEKCPECGGPNTTVYQPKTKSGRVLTAEDIERFAEEAERGFPLRGGSRPRRRRPPAR